MSQVSPSCVSWLELKWRWTCLPFQKSLVNCNKNWFKVAHFVLLIMFIYFQGKSKEIMNSMLERCCAEKTKIILRKLFCNRCHNVTPTSCTFCLLVSSCEICSGLDLNIVKLKISFLTFVCFNKATTLTDLPLCAKCVLLGNFFVKS